MTVLPALAPRTRLGLEIAAAGVAGGIIGDALLRAMPWGLNVAVGTAALVGTGAWLVRRHHVKHGPDTAWLAITALLLGLAFLRRDAETLAAFDALALIGALALTAASSAVSVRRWRANRRIKVETSTAGRFQLSDEKAYSVSAVMPHPGAIRTTRRTASAPARCPAARGSPRRVAQRPLPSMTMATWKEVLCFIKLSRKKKQPRQRARVTRINASM